MEQDGGWLVKANKPVKKCYVQTESFQIFQIAHKKIPDSGRQFCSHKWNTGLSKKNVFSSYFSDLSPMIRWPATTNLVVGKKNLDLLCKDDFFEELSTKTSSVKFIKSFKLSRGRAKTTKETDQNKKDEADSPFTASSSILSSQGNAFSQAIKRKIFARQSKLGVRPAVAVVVGGGGVGGSALVSKKLAQLYKKLGFWTYGIVADRLQNTEFVDNFDDYVNISEYSFESSKRFIDELLKLEFSIIHFGVTPFAIQWLNGQAHYRVESNYAKIVVDAFCPELNPGGKISGLFAIVHNAANSIDAFISDSIFGANLIRIQISHPKHLSLSLIA